jgi:Arc/MetJ-type ribon-helix-helix transcriptional regulator
MSEQIAVRLPHALASSLDDLVTGGRFSSRAEAVRAAIEQLIDGERRRRLGAEIAAGYRQMPQTDEEVAAATTAAIRSIEEEPW